MQRYPQRASTYRGRLLMSLHWDENKQELEPETFHTKHEIEPLKYAPANRLIPRLVKKRRHASARARTSLGSVRAHAMTSAASACVAVRRFMALRYAGVSAAGGSPTAGRGSGRYDSRAPSSSHQRMLYAQ